MFKSLLKDRFLDPVLNFLKQGVTPQKLAVAMALGMAIGVFPVLGVTTGICALVALTFRTNMAVTQLANYLVYPLQILLIIPLAKLGSWVLSVDPIPYSLDEIIEVFKSGFFEALNTFSLTLLTAVTGWMILILPFSFVSYWAFLRFFERVKIRA